MATCRFRGTKDCTRIYLFIWLCQVLGVMHGTFDLMQDI